MDKLGKQEPPRPTYDAKGLALQYSSQWCQDDVNYARALQAALRGIMETAPDTGDGVMHHRRRRGANMDMALALGTMMMMMKNCLQASELCREGE